MSEAKSNFSEFSEDDERHDLAQEAKTLLQRDSIVWSAYQSHDSPLFGFSPECFSYLKDLNEESFVLRCKENYLEDLKLSKESERPKATNQILSTQVKTNLDASSIQAKHLSFDSSSNELSQSMTKNLEKHSSVKIIQPATDPENLTKGFTPVSKISDVSQNVSTSQTQEPISMKLIGSATELENLPQKYIPLSTISDVSKNVSIRQAQQSTSVKLIGSAIELENLPQKNIPVSAISDVSQNVSTSQTQQSTSVKLIGSATELENLPQKYIPVSTISDVSQNVSTSQTQQSTSVKLVGSATKKENFPQDHTPVSELISDISQNVSTRGSMRSASAKVRAVTWTPAVLENKSCSNRDAFIDNEKDNISNELFTLPPKNFPSETMTSPEIENMDSKTLVYCITQFESLLKSRDNCLLHIYNSLCNFKNSLQLLCHHMQTMVHFLHKISTLKGDYISEKLEIYIFDTMSIASLLLLTLGALRRRILMHIQFWVLTLEQIRKIHSNYIPLESHGKPLVSFKTLQDYEKALKSIWIFLDNEIDLAESMRLHFWNTEKDFEKFLNMFIECLVMVGMIIKP